MHSLALLMMVRVSVLLCVGGFFSFFFILHLNAVLYLCLCFRSAFGPHADEGLAVCLCSSDISSLMKFACPPPPPLWLPPFPHQLLFPTHRCLPPVCLESIYFDLCPPPFLLDLYFHNPPFFFIIFLHLPASFLLLRYFWPSIQWYPFCQYYSLALLLLLPP